VIIVLATFSQYFQFKKWIKVRQKGGFKVNWNVFHFCEKQKQSPKQNQKQSNLLKTFFVNMLFQNKLIENEFEFYG